MTRILAIFAALMLSLPAKAQPIRLSEPVAQDATTETFGQVIDNKLPNISMASLATDSQKHLKQRFKTQARIAKVCQKKGCFFIAQQDEHVLRVSFKDYGFFIPTDSSGKTVTLAGQLIEKNISKAQSAHFNADLNSQKEVVKPGVVYEIVAEAVQIPKS